MNDFFVLLFESCSVISLLGLLITLHGASRAPIGFQHQNLFYYGTPPAGLIPVEDDNGPRYADWI